jgi:cobalt-zinc-cadmium efflux system outer membrane protein
MVLLAAPSARAAAPAAEDSIPPDSTLGLEWVERAALARNPSLAAMREAWREARARADQAGALEDPMLDAMVAPRSLGSSAVDAGYRIGITQRVPLFGQRGLRRRAAVAEGEALAGDVATARLDLLRDVRDAYYDYYKVCRGQETNRELAELMRGFRKVALAKYAAGTVGQTDPLQAEAELAMLEHQRVVLAQQRRVIVSRMRALLHLSQLTVLPEPPRELPLPEMPETGEWMDVRLKAAWPELQAAEARVRAGRAELALARRERLPESALGVAYDRAWSEPELRASVGLSLNLPLNLGRLGAREREKEAALRRAEDERLAIRDRIDQAIEEASAAFGEGIHDVGIMSDEVVPATERTVRAIQAAYEANRSDFLTLLNATRDLARTRLQLHEAVATAHQAHARLLRALATDAARPEQEEGR